MHDRGGYNRDNHASSSTYQRRLRMARSCSSTRRAEVPFCSLDSVQCRHHLSLLVYQAFAALSRAAATTERAHHKRRKKSAAPESVCRGRSETRQAVSAGEGTTEHAEKMETTGFGSVCILVRSSTGLRAEKRATSAENRKHSNSSTQGDHVKRL